jgi:hypothetical protein
MGLFDRGNMREAFRDKDEPSCRLPRRWLAIAVVCVVSLVLAYRIGSRYFFPDQWNSVERVLNMDSVGWAGIGWSGVSPDRIAALRVPCALEIDSVVPGGPADNAGLRRGDLIVGLAGKSFTSVAQLQGDARCLTPGQTVTVNINRAGTALAVEVTLCSWQNIKRLNATGGISL